MFSEKAKKILKNLPLSNVKTSVIFFFQILWPSHNSCTLSRQRFARKFAVYNETFLFPSSIYFAQNSLNAWKKSCIMSS